MISSSSQRHAYHRNGMSSGLFARLLSRAARGRAAPRTSPRGASGLPHFTNPPPGFAMPEHWFLRFAFHLTPSWFAVSMSTGALSIALRTTPYAFDGEFVIAAIVYVLNILIFIVLLLASVVRYWSYPWIWSRMIRHPVQSLFLGMAPIALSTVVEGTVLLAVPAFGQWAITLAWVLWWIDVAISMAVCLGLPMTMFHMQNHSLDALSAAYLLPVVPPVVAAASGSLVASVLPPDYAFITLCVSCAMMGAGLSLSLIVMTLFFLRLSMHKLPTREVIVSSFSRWELSGRGSSAL